MKKRLRDNGLAIVMLALFVFFWVAMSVAGWHDTNDERADLRLAPLNYLSYLGSGAFWSATFENWESEFLQMSGYVWLTSFLFQRGSAESKDPDKPNPCDEDPRQHQDDPDAPGPVRSGGWKLKVYENSLALSLFLIFLGSFVGHAQGGAIRYSVEEQAHGRHAITVWQYLQTSSFWFESFQNWQSEFLAVGALSLLSIWLRQRNSPESKPVHFAHSQTGEG